MADFMMFMGPWMAMYEEMIGIPPGALEQIQELAVENYNDFKANATPEEKAFTWDFFAKFNKPENKEMRDNHNLKIKAEWNAADANADGLLNLDEFRAWYASSRATRREEGWFLPTDDADRAYNVMNLVTEGADGVSIADYYSNMSAYFRKWYELKASEAQ